MNVFEIILSTAGGLIVSFVGFISVKVWQLYSGFSQFKIDVFEKILQGQKEAEAIFNKQIAEGVLAHRRIDVMDRLVSSITDKEFNSSKTVCNGNETFPTTVRIRKIISSSQRDQ